MPSFDAVCEPDMVEVKNAFDNAAREVGTRFDFKGTPAAAYASNAELATAGNWEVVKDLKNIPIVCLRHKIA